MPPKRLSPAKKKKAPIRLAKKPMGKKPMAQSRRARAMAGAGLFDWISKAVNWVKDNKVISRIGEAVSSIPGMHPIVGTVTELAKTAGLGRKRSMGRPYKRGGAIRLAGRGLALAGGAKPKIHYLM